MTLFNRDHAIVCRQSKKVATIRKEVGLAHQGPVVLPLVDVRPDEVGQTDFWNLHITVGRSEKEVKIALALALHSN